MNINEKEGSIYSEDAQNNAVSILVRAVGGEEIPSNYRVNRRTSDASISSTEKHSKEYPCPQCQSSLASRLRYHIISKLKLRDTLDFCQQ
jgi:hypothetical protein